VLEPLDVRVLAALPMDLGPGHWLTPRGLDERVGLDVSVARSCLCRLRGRGLALDDGSAPQRLRVRGSARSSLSGGR
jgi:ribosomal protein S25